MSDFGECSDDEKLLSEKLFAFEQKSPNFVRRARKTENECRTVRIFISSTFKDFFNEREILVTRVTRYGD
jgi:hypothetical protein